MKKLITLLLVLSIMGLVSFNVYNNYRLEQAEDLSKIPLEIEENRNFQRWITNLKNKGIDVGADDFRLDEEHGLFNTKWLKIESTNDTDSLRFYKQTFDFYKKEKLYHVIFSPNDQALLDFRISPKFGFNANEPVYFGIRDGKIYTLRITDCPDYANCYFDRAYFIDDDIFVLTEFSLERPENDTTPILCGISEICPYRIKLHLVDISNNSRLEYKSPILELNLESTIPEL